MNRFSKQIDSILSEARVNRENGLFVVQIQRGGAQGKKYYKDPECMILHREDGPAIEYKYHPVNNKYYLDGKQFSKDEWIIRSKMGTKADAEDVKTAIDMINI